MGKDKKAHEQRQREKVAERTERAALRVERRRRHFTKEEWTEETRKLTEQLRKHGLAVRDVAGDGNCLFRAFADQVEDNADNHAHFRALACDFMDMNRDHFAPFFENFDDYLRDMRRLGEWGGNAELQALSAACGVNINIHQYDRPVWQIINHDRGRFINLSYHDGEHYCSLRPAGPPPPEPTRETVLPALPSQVAVKAGSSSSGSAAAASSSKGSDLLPTEDEKLVMYSTPCKDFQVVRRYLREFDGDVNAVIEYFILRGWDDDADLVEEFHADASDFTAAEIEAFGIQIVPTPAPAAAAAAAPKRAKDKQRAEPEPKRAAAPAPAPAPQSTRAKKISNKQRREDAKKEKKAEEDRIRQQQDAQVVEQLRVMAI
eukprot:TRINITY_DN2563_c0_g1_i1.p1 TRINITY_DN2563_c0_g1~~TRINITY_DN2563_c0_g1_i1.p1  ORF type:complete len:383 (+),score=88.08 TRINITY_DN2563_c0_g1_i1:26-1150(+)